MQNRSLHNETVRASANVSRCRAIGYDGAQATKKGQKILGVATTDAASSALVAVTVIGTALIETGAAIDRGDALIVDNGGRAIPAEELGIATGNTAVTSTSANGGVLKGAVLPDHVFADALASADGAGRFIEIKLR